MIGTSYVVPALDAVALNNEMPVGLVFASEEAPGVFLHFDLGGAEGWSINLDDAVQAAGVGVTYAEYIGALPNASTLDCKLYRYLVDAGSLREPPIGVDYRTDLDRRLHPKRTFAQGELTNVNYYATVAVNPDGTLAFDDLIVRENYVYTRDPAGFVISRSLTITWLREDESAHPTVKQMAKVYSPQERIAEGKRRRSNIINELEITVAGMLIATETTDPTDPVQVQAALALGRALLVDYRGDIIDFVEGSVQTIHTRLAAEATYPWLGNTVGAGTTIRDVMLASVNIWGL